ncbi:GNAT family acetyltransferase [Labrys neptuniae]|uniref:GNAT family acetyltransferase n=1 Tax=Labrys neptuniae TaxID=376174 RepID=A0ABV3PM48_9HYPH
MEVLSRVVFTVASICLMMLAGGLVAIAGFRVFHAAYYDGQFDNTLLDSIGFVVVGVAVFDVARYFLEEEVLRAREMRNAVEACRSLTKFMSAIVIAVFLEALVTVFKVAKQSPEQLLYPALLLFGGTAMIVGLGVYQKLSVSVERESPAEPRKEKAESKRKTGERQAEPS